MNPMTLEQVIAKAARISDLRKELGALEWELSQSLALGRSDSPRTDPHATLPGIQHQNHHAEPSHEKTTDVDGIIYQTIIKIADENPQKEYNAEDFVNLIPGVNVKSVRSSLSRGFKHNKLFRLARGKYCSTHGVIHDDKGPLQD
ncbi:MAG: hypothetical protein JWQ87_3947 [Candidatus Sulfotelmatobacter sp.]|nr:hypothetical protein [Candidatus Sulfotelmatobacter sp.]